jgi:hypothetical protein
VEGRECRIGNPGLRAQGGGIGVRGLRPLRLDFWVCAVAGTWGMHSPTVAFLKFSVKVVGHKLKIFCCGKLRTAELNEPHEVRCPGRWLRKKNGSVRFVPGFQFRLSPVPPERTCRDSRHRLSRRTGSVGPLRPRLKLADCCPSTRIQDTGAIH